MNEPLDRLLSEENITKLSEILGLVGEKISVGAEFVFEAYYKQVSVEAVGFGLFAVFSLFGFIFCGYQWRTASTEGNYYDDLTITSCVLTIVFFFMVFLFSWATIGRVVNPNYYLLHNILSIVR